MFLQKFCNTYNLYFWILKCVISPIRFIQRMGRCYVLLRQHAAKKTQLERESKVEIYRRAMDTSTVLLKQVSEIQVISPFGIFMDKWTSDNMDGGQKTTTLPQLIIFPGFNQSIRSQWAEFISKYIHKFSYIWAVHYPCHGMSPGPVGELMNITVDELIDMTAKCIDTAAETYPNCPVFCIGNSMGSLILLEIQRVKKQTAEKVSKWILMCPVPAPVHETILHTTLSLTPLLSRLFGIRSWEFSNKTDEQIYENDEFIVKRLPPTAETLWNVHQLCSRVQHYLIQTKDSKITYWNNPSKTCWIHGADDSIMPLTKLQTRFLNDTNVFLKIIPDTNHSLLFGVPNAVKQIMSQKPLYDPSMSKDEETFFASLIEELEDRISNSNSVGQNETMHRYMSKNEEKFFASLIKQETIQEMEDRITHSEEQTTRDAECASENTLVKSNKEKK